VRKFGAALFATESRQNKNLDSIGDKVTRLILQDFFDFSAPRISNTIGNIEAKSNPDERR